MNITNKLYSIMHLVRTQQIELNSLLMWAHGSVCNALNIPRPNSVPNGAQGGAMYDTVNQPELLIHGGERELHDYIKGVVFGEIYPSVRASFGDPNQWLSEHFEFHNNTLRPITFQALTIDHLPSLNRQTRNYSKDDKNAMALMLGPDGTIIAHSADGTEGIVYNAENRNARLVLELPYGAADQGPKTFKTTISLSGWAMESQIVATLEPGHPSYTVYGNTPLEYVKREDFETALFSYIKGSEEGYNERLKARTMRVWDRLTADPHQSSVDFYGSISDRLTNDSSNGGIYVTSKPWDLSYSVYDYNQDQPVVNNLYLVIANKWMVAPDPIHRDVVFGEIWDTVPDHRHRLALYVRLLCLLWLKHNCGEALTLQALYDFTKTV